MGTARTWLARTTLALAVASAITPAAASATPATLKRSVENLTQWPLDLALSPLRLQVEKTYSAPFATRAYAREAIEQPDGTVVRENPRLRWAGAHLARCGRD